MGRKAKELSALEVQRLVQPGLHAVGVVPGLHLRVKSATSRQWMMRVVVGATRRDIGLGGYPEVTLALARDKGRALREQIKAGVDPVERAKSVRSALRAEQARSLTFKECAEAYIEAHEAGWRNAKHGQQWRNTLSQYAYPTIGAMLVRDVSLASVLRVLEPIWRTKTETASRLRGRMESVLDWAKGRGYRDGDNPAAWKGNLDAQLPRPEKVAKTAHHAALPIAEVGPFMARLRTMAGMGARAVEFAVLTAARSGEVRGARWSEIDLQAGVWVIPGERMKAGREHRVPLSRAALRVLQAVPRIDGGDLIFQAARGGTLSDMTLTAVLKRMEVPATVHGFRSSFRDWAAERTSYPREVAEMALAHTVGNAVERAYLRSDMFEKRRLLMEDWANHCAQLAEVSATVIVIDRAALAA